jgi:hypothetical protein
MIQRIQFKSNERDFVAQQIYLNTEIANPFSSRKYLIVSYAFLIISILCNFISIGSISLSFLFPIFAVLFIMTNFYFIALSVKLGVNQMRKNGKKYGLDLDIICEYTFNKDFMTSKQDSVYSEIPWHEIKHIHKEADYIFLLLDFTQFLVIPKRAVTIQADFDLLFEDLKQHINSKREER